MSQPLLCRSNSLDEIWRESLKYRTPTLGEPFKRLTGKDTKTMRVVRVDKASDLLFDFQRSKEMCAQADAVLSCSSLPLKVDCVFLSALDQSLIFQEEISYFGHFPHEHAVTFLLPMLSAGAFTCSIIRNRSNIRLTTSQDTDYALADGELPLNDWESASFPRHQLTTLKPLDILRLEPGTWETNDILLMFGYRSSQYRNLLSMR